MESSPQSARGGRVAVVAVGGNALIREGQIGTHREQVRAAKKVARSVLTLIREGYRVLVVHGNGPQVGRELIRSEEASTKVPPRPLDVCVASTQGTIGDLLARELRNAMKRTGLKRPVSCVLTQVLVSREDPGFGEPTKPIGPFYSRWRAKELSKQTGWKFVEDAGRGWRRVVSSPKPVDVFGIETIETLLEARHVVVAGGGGGVPLVVDPKGRLEGIEAVIDKDRTAALMGTYIGADVMIVLTAVDQVYVNFGRPEQLALERVTAEEMQEYHDAGHFPPGSMGPKVEAALMFLADGGSAAVITSEGKLAAAMNDRAGTRIVREESAGGVFRQLDLFPGADGDDAGDLDDDDD